MDNILAMLFGNMTCTRQKIGFYFQNRKCSTEHEKGRDEKQAKNFLR